MVVTVGSSSNLPYLHHKANVDQTGYGMWNVSIITKWNIILIFELLFVPKVECSHEVHK